MMGKKMKRLKLGIRMFGLIRAIKIAKAYKEMIKRVERK